MSAPIRRVVVGTAGHIDHGKSTLVHTLTGVDPDRLKEEKERGMTIDLGFAPYRTAAGRTVGFIDVPGHERFVRHMVAGATSVDLFVLVVAADDGVMPQTREHVEILDLLGARQGLVAVTKIDAVDADLRELALAEIAEYLEDTPFAETPLLPVSSVTGEGLAEFRAALESAIEGVDERAADGLFRMPVQRVFSAHGHGTVLTGVPISGSTGPGDLLEVLPHGIRGRVRAIQAYREERERAAAGHSTALNLADVDHRTVRRGDVVATPDIFSAASLFEARLRLLPSASRPLEHGAVARLHVGTAETLARVALLDRAQLAPGDEALVQLRLRDPVVAAPGDRYLLRRVSPAATLGGGTLVAASERRLGPMRPSVIAAVEAKERSLPDLEAYLEEILRGRGARPTAARDAARLLHVTSDRAAAALAALVAAGRVAALARGRVVHRDAFDSAAVALDAALERFHAEQPLRAWADALALRTALRLDEELFEAAAAGLAASGAIERGKGGRLRLARAAPRLAPAEEVALEGLRARLEAAGLAPPSTAELAREQGLSESRTAALLALLVEFGEVERAGEFYFATTAVERAIAQTRAVAARHAGEIVVPELRDALGTTRKYLIPLLERLDAKGLTVRRGDKRYAVARPATEAP